jgi:hypothetical protein
MSAVEVGESQVDGRRLDSRARAVLTSLESWMAKGVNGVYRAEEPFDGTWTCGSR